MWASQLLSEQISSLLLGAWHCLPSGRALFLGGPLLCLPRLATASPASPPSLKSRCLELLQVFGTCWAGGLSGSGLSFNYNMNYKTASSTAAFHSLRTSSSAQRTQQGHFVQILSDKGASWNAARILLCLTLILITPTLLCFRDTRLFYFWNVGVGICGEARRSVVVKHRMWNRLCC